MKIRYIALWIDHPLYSGIEANLGYYFSNRTRFIENFLSKSVRKDSIESDKFNMISVQPVLYGGTGLKVLEYSKVLQVFLQVEQQELDNFLLMSDLQKYEYFLQLHERGYHEADNYYDIGIDRLLSYNDVLRKNGFKNEWLFKKKQIKKYGIYIYLDCFFSSFDFNLYLSVYDLKKTHLIARKSIFHTHPDEQFYQKDLRKVFFEDEKFFITDFLDRPICEYKYKDLAGGDIKVNILNDHLKTYQFSEGEQGKYHWKGGRSIAETLGEI